MIIFRHLYLAPLPDLGTEEFLCFVIWKFKILEYVITICYRISNETVVRLFFFFYSCERVHIVLNSIRSTFIYFIHKYLLDGQDVLNLGLTARRCNVWKIQALCVHVYLIARWTMSSTHTKSYHNC